MLSFIEDVKKGIVYSFEKSIEKKKDVIELIRANRAAYVEGEPDKNFISHRKSAFGSRERLNR